ncbi:msx2-interacting protein isoform X4 [Notamacropus eugenii]|uniref:msx2-interacting protein isoform X4 n=1 Tax=Notamacropus eugenii TaxID=9315 RepID=UPI003B67D646
MVRETRHLWVGNLPENVREEKIIEHFKRYGRVESVKILPKRGSEGGVAAFVDFVDIKSAQKAHNSVNKMGDRDLRTDYNEPGTIPSAARGLDDTVSIASRSREVSGFRGSGGGPTYGPPPSLHAREGRYERRLDGASDNRERAYEHSAYGHHERGTGGFDRTRHYDQDYYRDPRERTLQHGLYYTSSRSRSPNRFDAHEPRYEPRAREQFTLPSVVHRDIYRDEITREVRGRRPERNYQHSRSRSPHSSQSRNQSPQRLASQATRPARSPSGSGSKSRSSSSDSLSSSSSTSSDSSDSSSSSSDESPARSVQSTAVPAPTSQLPPSLEKEEPRKSFGIKVQNLPVRSTETESENEFRPLDERIDEFHPKATRTLFIGNLEKTTTYHDLRNIFQRFGEIVDIDIKKVNGVPQYAFLQYCDITSVCKAIKKMDGEYLGNNRLKLGFGKSMPTNCVWLDGLSTNITDQYLTRHFCRYGPVVKVDFANRESQLAFYHSMEKSGQDIRDFYEMLSERRDERRGSYEYTTDRTYYESVRTPGSYSEDPRREYPARGREFYPDWDSYQGDYYEPRYYDDPREYRDYRNDPYEQDIREYSYRQRERERERERFESDRDRDHERRPIERSQSPAHSRRAPSPVVPSPQSERHQSDSERRVYSRSSDRSGSCSSVSPPRYDKFEKTRIDRYTKIEKPDKERTFDPERVEKEKRPVRKEKPERAEKDKPTFQQRRKAKIHSPGSQSSETDQENERDPSPEKLKIINKQSKEKADKEGTAKNRLDLMPCVVLTRVKEKEGKVIEQPFLEKLRTKIDNDSAKSPFLDQRFQLFHADTAKSGDQTKLDSVRSKVPKEKVQVSHLEATDKEGKPKPKKHLKDSTAEGVSAVDQDKLEARKRRFADGNLKPDRQKLEVKKSNLDEDDAKAVFKRQPETSAREVTVLRDAEPEKKPIKKDIFRREPKKLERIKLEKLISAPSPKECQELASISVGIMSKPPLDLHTRVGDTVEEPVESPEILSKKFNLIKPQHKQPQPLDDQGTEKEEIKKNLSGVPEEMAEHKSGQEKPQSTDNEEKIGIDIDHTQSYRKQMEQSRRKQQMELEIAKSEKFGSPKKEVDEYERRSLVHEVGKPPQDVTDDSPPSKKKKVDHFDFEIGTKRERNYRSSRQISEDAEKTACSPSIRHFPFHEEDETVDSPRLIPLKETKESPKIDEKSVSYSNVTIREEALKFNPYDSSKKEQMADMAKIKLSGLNTEDEPSRWESQMKAEPNRVDVSFPSSIIKRDSLRKRSIHRDLEPGEVPSDSDEDGEQKSHSPKTSSLLENSRLSFLLREREDKVRERDERLSGSLERNKFYSFALDKTITPDTKALLERAKSLSSSREENWSFLDWDSRFASFRNNKDKEKVDSAPRPIPSWYMKKKKIRTDSEGKLDDKKDDHKEEEQERQELFASRFLHSSIFEQDSKRLQHLERKDEEPDLLSNRIYGRQTSSDGSNSTSDLIQEPVVLFHSRFIELTRMQQKEKEKDQKPKEVEKQEDKENRPETLESVPEHKEPELRSPFAVGPPLSSTVSQEPCPLSLEKEKTVEVPSGKEEQTVEVVSLTEPKCIPEHATVTMEQPEKIDLPSVSETNKEIVPVPLVSQENLSAEHPSYLDTKPPTPGASFSSQVDISIDPEPESTPLISPLSKPVQKPEEPSEVKEEKPAPAAKTNCDTSQKVEVLPEVQPPGSDNDLEVEPPVVAKDKKSNKSKRSKTPVQPAVVSVPEKPVTRKSERIDREKLKRSNSPRGETQKLTELKMEAEKISRNAAKSPSSAVETENIEPSLPLSRTRRRNVRSVYANPGDREEPSPVKDPVEQPRSTRKREREAQEMVSLAATPRRGRPPKTRRRAEEDSPVKAEQDAEEAEPKDTMEPLKLAEGWRSPRSQKSATPTGLQGKRGKSEQKVDVAADPPEEANEMGDQESNINDSSTKPKSDKEETEAGGNEQKRDKKEVDPDKNSPEAPSVETVEKKQVPEKSSKYKRGRSRNTKPLVDKASLCLKNVEIRLNVDEVKGALRPTEEEGEPVTVPLSKTKNSPKEDNLSPQFKNEPEDLVNESENEVVREPKQSPEAAQLAKQIELEQAVENIAKLTETSLTAYKEPAAEVTEVHPEEEGDKPAHQASETELAAAIGSIINDISGEPENFPAPPTYSAESEAEISTEPLVLPSPQAEMEPETDQAVSGILETDAVVEPSVPPASDSAPSALPADPKDPEGTVNASPSSTQEPEVVSQDAEVSRKDRARQKAARSRRKRSSSKKGDAVEANALASEQAQNKCPVTNEQKLKPPETPKEDKQNKNPHPISSEANPADSNKNPANEMISTELAAEEDMSAKAPAPLDLPPQAVPVDDGSQASFKVRSASENAPITPPSVPSTPTPTIPSAASAKLPTPIPSGMVPHHSSTTKVADWITRHEEARARSTPPPALPPDTKASDIDTNSSTLRKILMEPKYVSATSITSTHVTAAIAEPVSAPRLEEGPHPPVESIKPLSEEKPAVPIPNTSDLPAAEVPVFTEKEKVTTVIAPKATSVISRMPISNDLEESPRAAAMKQTQSVQTCLGNALSSKYKPWPSTNENSRFHPGSMSVIEDRPSETGSSPGLRVNTSEGVVLLSYSGQKTEGPQRISAKISQIPPASAMDIEFQQSMSKPQVKQESVMSSQPTPKLGSQTPTGYGNVPTHSSLVLGSQPYSTSPVIASIKQERPSLEKLEPSHLSVSTPVNQAGPGKVLSQAANTPPVLVHSQLVLSPSIPSTNKKPPDPVSLKVETKGLQPSNLSPGLSSHHPPSLSGKLHSEANHVGSGPSTPTDRAISHLGVLKQEPHSPRTSGHSPSPFPRACHPSSTSSPVLSNNASVMLAPGIPVPQYISSMHPEQSVIMPPHSITQTVSLSHLSQGEVRMNTPPLPSIPYGIRPEGLHSPRATLQPQIEIRPQRSGTPQPAPLVLPPLSSQHPSEDEIHYHHPVCRGSAPVQPEVLVMQPEYRMHPYNMPREMRLIRHPHVATVGEHHLDTRQSRTPEGSAKTPPTSKTPQPGKETPTPKAPEVTMAPSPHSEPRLLSVPPGGGQLAGLPLTPPAGVPHGVQIIRPTGDVYHEYRYGDLRSYHTAPQLGHPQFPGASQIGLSSRSMTPSQIPAEGEHTHPGQPVRSKTPQVSQEVKATQTGAPEQTQHMAGNRHSSQLDSHLHIQRAQAEASQTSYPSPVAVSIKTDLPSPHTPQAGQKQPLLIPTTSGPGAPSGLPRPESQPVIKQELSPQPISQRPVDMVQLLKKYPIVWQGLLALKNDTAAVQLHFVSGNNVLAHRSLPTSEVGPPLRIAQRMRLEASQLEGVARRMGVETDYCLLLALPCGRDQEDVVNQTESLKAAFITYLQTKQAAGIINVANLGSNQPAYVLQIFPPCEFSERHLSRLAPDLLASISNISPHLMIIIASV